MGLLLLFMGMTLEQSEFFHLIWSLVCNSRQRSGKKSSRAYDSVSLPSIFSNDVYHGGKIISDGVIPEEVVKTSAILQRRNGGFDVPQDIYIHVCGSDLIRDEKGKYLVLEDNARCPSGASIFWRIERL